MRPLACCVQIRASMRSSVTWTSSTRTARQLGAIDVDGSAGFRYLYVGEYIPTPTIIFRRSILSEALRLDESYVDAADYDFYLRLLRGRCCSERESAARPFSLPLEQQDRIQFCASGRRGSQDSPALCARARQAVAHGGRVSGSCARVGPWPPRGPTFSDRLGAGSLVPRTPRRERMGTLAGQRRSTASASS